MSELSSTNSQYYLDNVSASFDEGCATLMTDLGAAEDLLESDASNPSYLANYQAKLQEYTLYRNAQSTVVKTYRDVDQTILQHF